VKRFLEIIVGLHTVGGAVFFAALYVAPISLSLKVLAAIVLMFVTSALFLALVSHLALARAYQLLIEQICRVMERQRIDLPIVDTPSLLDYLEYDLTGGLKMGKKSVSRMGYLLLGMFVFWIIGGGILSRYVI